MKSLLVTALAAMGIVHGGAFLTVWDLPYMGEHFTYQDLGRKLDKVFKIADTHNSLRNKREKVNRENEDIFAEQGGRPVTTVSRSYRGSFSTTSSSARR